MIDYVLLEEYCKEISVLLVEDEENVAIEMKNLLVEIFRKVDMAFDGQEALNCYFNYFKENKKHYDLIISDINMPNMNGIDLSKNIKNINPTQKIVILSAHNEVENLMDLIDVGIEQFILKPFNYDDFFEKIFKVSKEIHKQNFNLVKDSNIIKLHDNLTWDKEKKVLFYNQNDVKLTKKEILFFEVLLKTPNKTCSNEEIISKLWEDEFAVGDITNVKNIISRIRKKIPILNIENIYGFGYRINII